MFRLLIALLAVASLSIAVAEATPRTTAAISAYKKVQRDQRLLKQRFDRLSTGEKIDVKNFIENSKYADEPGADPDNDGLDSEAEEAFGSNSCDSDSDDDGTNDGDDDYEDGEDGAYAKGTVVSFANRVVTIGSISFIIDDNTEFRGHGFSEDDLVEGVCVEIEGHVLGSDKIADKIKRERSGECQGGNDD